MFKLFIFTICVISSPSFGLLESLYQGENDCYSGCHLNYADSLRNLNSCKIGCDYKFQNEDCISQCKSNLITEQGQASCLVGCSMSQGRQVSQRAMILVRLRVRPILRLSSINSNQVQTFNDVIRRLTERTNTREQSNELKTVIQLAKHIPIIKSTDEIHSPKVLSKNENKIESVTEHFQRSVSGIRHQLDNLISKQPRLPAWILLGIFLLSSAILLKMIVSICKTPKHSNLAIRDQELVFENADGKEKFHSNEQNCKVNLGNI